MTLRPFEISRIARLARALKDDGGVENMDVLGRYSLIGQLPYVLHSNIHSTFRGCNKRASGKLVTLRCNRRNNEICHCYNNIVT